MNPTHADVALCAGPFHVPRHADLALLRQALRQAPECLLVLTAAHLPRSPRNPFTWQERAALVDQSLDAPERARLRIHPLRDGYNPARASADILRALPAGARVTVLHPGDAAPALPFDMPAGWSRAAVPTEPPQPTSDHLRDLLLASPQPAEALAAVAPHVPPAVLRFLTDWTAGPDYLYLREEHAQLAREKAAWSAAPYPVVLVTVDAVVRASGHVLLIRRGRAPGKGLRALPGGFLDTGETILQSALRELHEETGLAVPELRAALREVRVFDDPARSQRGRVITHAHYFDLGERALPPVAGGDDAAAAEWVPIERLPAMAPQFLDDHFHILDCFLRLLD